MATLHLTLVCGMSPSYYPTASKKSSCLERNEKILESNVLGGGGSLLELKGNNELLFMSLTGQNLFLWWTEKKHTRFYTKHTILVTGGWQQVPGPKKRKKHQRTEILSLFKNHNANKSWRKTYTEIYKYWNWKDQFNSLLGHQHMHEISTFKKITQLIIFCF